MRQPLSYPIYSSGFLVFQYVVYISVYELHFSRCYAYLTRTFGYFGETADGV